MARARGKGYVKKRAKVFYGHCKGQHPSKRIEAPTVPPAEVCRASTSATTTPVPPTTPSIPSVPPTTPTTWLRPH